MLRSCTSHAGHARRRERSDGYRPRANISLSAARCRSHAGSDSSDVVTGAECHAEHPGERGKREHLERVLVAVAADRQVAPVGAEDRGLVAVGVQDQRPALYAQGEGRAFLPVKPGEQHVRGGLIAVQGGRQPAAGCGAMPASQPAPPVTAPDAVLAIGILGLFLAQTVATLLREWLLV